MTEDETALADAELDDRLDGMAEKTEDFYVPLRDKIMGILSFVGMVAAIVLFILCVSVREKILDDMFDALKVPGGTAAIVTVSGDIAPGEHIPSAVHQTIETAIPLSAISLVSLPFAGIMLLFPKFMWQIGTLRYRVFYGWDTPPSDFAIILRKVATYILFAIGMGSLLWAYWVYLPIAFLI